MNLLVTGGTGFIGTALVKHLLHHGHCVSLFIRSPEKATRLFGDNVSYVQNWAALDPNQNFDGVINLAGENVGAARWTTLRKHQLMNSRISVTRELVEWILGASSPPRFLLSGSASGFYGDMGDQILSEADSGKQQGFTHHLCQQWELTALRAEAAGTRVCLLRTALVLHPAAPAFKKMAIPVKLGIGGPMGSGKQYMPWIELQDVIGALLFLMEHEPLSGPVNLCSPQALTQRAFVQALAKHYHRPCLLKLPEFMLKMLLGEQACLVLDSAHMVPGKLLAAGFEFSCPNIAQFTASLNHA